MSLGDDPSLDVPFFIADVGPAHLGTWSFAWGHNSLHPLCFIQRSVEAGRCHDAKVFFQSLWCKAMDEGAQG